MTRFLLYRLFILILCLALAFGASLDSEGYDSEAELSSTPEIPAPSPLSFTPKHETAIVAAPDGMIHLVELSSGKILWSFASGPSIYSSFQALPDNHGDDHNVSTERKNFYIDCGEDWKLYLHGDNFEKVELPCSVDEFLKSTPSILAGGVVLGSKKTTAFLVDSKSGRVIRTCRSDTFGDKEAGENPILARNDLEDWAPSSTVDMDLVDNPLYIMRTDYAIKYTSTKTGKVLWNLQFADFEASLQCERIEKFLGRLSHKENEFGPAHEVCQTRPLVYRIRDRSALESLLMSVRSQNAFPGGRSISLPPADYNLVMPVDKLFRFHQNNEGEVVHALPSPLAAPSTDEFPIMGLPVGDNQVVLTGSYIWSFVLFGTLVLFIVAFLFNLVSLVKEKLYKSVDKKKEVVTPISKMCANQSQAVDKKKEVVTPKKKKLQNDGINKKSPNFEKGKKKVFTDETSLAHGLPDIGNTEDQMQVNLFDRLDLVDGRKIGKLFVSNKEIAKGSNGTVVLEGTYEGRPVAVKRLVKAHHDIAQKEIQNLIVSDSHPNIVRWYGTEYDQDFIYLSLERCTCSLYELVLEYSNSFEKQIYGNHQDPISRSNGNQKVQWTSNNNHNIKDFELWKDGNCYPSPKLLKLLSDIVRGLAHLHELNIIHRDLKPQNVLIVEKTQMCAKISDMGISKSLPEDMSSLTRNATGCGSSGWQAPEQLLRECQTFAVDLFSLGCVLFFCITGGKHPYGESFERDVNIRNDQKDLFLIENIPEATNLISQLLHPNPKSRPTAKETLNHPLFWKPERRLYFLRDASDRVELEDRDNSDVVKALESIKTEALGGQWDLKLDSALINDITRHRRYNYNSVRDLLRVIRNKLSHYGELSTEIQELLGQVPEGFDSYFSSRFPRLLIQVYTVIRIYCKEEKTFSAYFQDNNHI